MARLPNRRSGYRICAPAPAPFSLLEFRGSVVNDLEDTQGGGLDMAYEAVTNWLEDLHDSNAAKLPPRSRRTTAT